MEVIVAGTRVGASIEKGKVADIIAVQRNPLEDLSVMKDTCLVMKAGELVGDLEIKRFN